MDKSKIFLATSLIITLIGNGRVIKQFQERFDDWLDHPYFRFLLLFALIYSYTTEITISIAGATILLMLYIVFDIDDDKKEQRIIEQLPS